MYKQTRIFLIVSIVIMAVFGYGVRTSLMAPKQPVEAGPDLVSHGVNEHSDYSCADCHGKQRAWHMDTYGEFESDDCMNCHGNAAETPHATDGEYADCVSCHGGITPGHDEMFGYPKTTYSDCISCHQAQ